jgi:hypothetical protein
MLMKILVDDTPLLEVKGEGRHHYMSSNQRNATMARAVVCTTEHWNSWIIVPIICLCAEKWLALGADR